MSIPGGDAPAPPVRRAFGRALDFAEVLAVMLLTAAGLAAWWSGINTADYDYDEILRAHSIWLAGRGLAPYAGFFDNHPPYFPLLTPIVRGAGDPCSTLFALRLFSAVGNLTFLSGLTVLALTASGGGRTWAFAGVALVACHPDILSFLVDFRIDGWGYALVAWAAVRLRRRRDRAGRYFEFGLVTGLAAGLFCPKLFMLPPAVVAFESLSSSPEWRRRLERLGGYILGVSTAVVLFLAYLLACGSGIERTLLLLGRYNAEYNAHSSYRYGLLQEVGHTPTLTLPILAGVAVWLAAVVRRRATPDPYLAALVVWLASQVLLVAYPYRQYYAPWFLLGSGFVAVLGGAVRALWRPLGTALLLLTCAATANSTLAQRRDWSRTQVARLQCELIRILNRLAGPDDRVVAVPPYHPIDRYDAFFLSSNTTDPSGYDTERIMGAIPGLRPFVTASRFRSELEANPPAFVVLEADGVIASYLSGQWRVLRPFLRERGYRPVRVGPLRLAVRPDRIKPAGARPAADATAPSPVAPVPNRPPPQSLPGLRRVPGDPPGPDGGTER